MHTTKMGVIGCGQISSIYLQNCTQMFENLEVVACADLVPELAQKRAAEYGVPRACSIEELLGDPEIELVLNLTSPLAHTAVNLQALGAGKHVYTEKPFAMTREDADRVLAFAEDRGLRVGCAPDTVLGGGIQTCRRILDEGRIGTPYMANGLILMGNAYRSTHPQFHTFLQLGWDPLYDMAPYYLTALITLLGPARRVSGSTGQVRSEVTVTDPESPRYGQTFPVGAPMHAATTIDFANGTIAGLQVAKESFGYTPRLEIYGTEGILYLPDPNIFGGPIQILQPDGVLVDIPWSHGYTENSRGLGVADMAAAIRSGVPHRASGELARHVIDITLGVFESSRTERHVAMTTSVGRPEPMEVASSQ